jgi:hypothetical protein
MKLFLLVLVEYGIDCRVARPQYAIALDVGARYRVERGAGCVSDDLDEMFLSFQVLRRAILVRLTGFLLLDAEPNMKVARPGYPKTF